MEFEETTYLKTDGASPSTHEAGVELPNVDEPARSTPFQAFLSLIKAYVNMGVMCLPYSSRKVKLLVL